MRPASELTSDSSHGTSQSCQQKSNHKLNRKGKDERGNDQIQALCWVWGSGVLQPHWSSGGFPAFLELVRVLLASVSIPILDARTKDRFSWLSIGLLCLFRGGDLPLEAGLGGLRVLILGLGLSVVGSEAYWSHA